MLPKKPAIKPTQKHSCYHCSEPCDDAIKEAEKVFCCHGCRQVYLLLQENDLCSYYDFASQPGIKAKGKFVSERFAYLEEESVINRLVQFRSPQRIHVTFRLPQMHCSSCIYLLEHLRRIDEGILHSSVNFQRREIFISFNPELISLRKVVELLAFIGYEPDISLEEPGKRKRPKRRREIFIIGLTGFCVSNIMMLSFPEYLSASGHVEPVLQNAFSWLIFALSIPVLLIGAGGIFRSAWSGLRAGDLNIDVPIALAIVITFGRSYFEILTQTGAGYLDSGSGIIFFMLVGRWFQGKSNDALSFDRDYKAYFPLGVTRVEDGRENNIPVTDLRPGDTIVLRSGDMIPADAQCIKGDPQIDYSFVTGEVRPVSPPKGSMLFAGGKQMGGALYLQVVKSPSQSYITELWNNKVFHDAKQEKDSFVHPWSRYFTAVLLTIAALTAIYWYNTDVSKIFPAVTAVLIVACPCSLLLTATFTFGGMLRQLGKRKLYLRNASVIENMAMIDTIVLDKTGTVTRSGDADVVYKGEPLSDKERSWVKLLTAQSAHTLSRTIFDTIPDDDYQREGINAFEELTGKGIRARMNGVKVELGSPEFTGWQPEENLSGGSRVYVSIDEAGRGYFEVRNRYRRGFKRMVSNLLKRGYRVHILSGDNEAEKRRLRRYFGEDVKLKFKVTPEEKLEYISGLQQKGAKVLMMGDGLNDAGALKQSDVGIAVSDHSARFTPSSDGIVDGGSVTMLHHFLRYAKKGKGMIAIGFVLSILYNFVGLSFAVQARLSPLVAAILMPASSLTLIGLAALLTWFKAKKMKQY